jgi:hypothetical protein
MSLTPKTAAAGIGGAITGTLIWILGDGFHIQVSAEHGAYLATIVAFICAYLAPNSDPTPEQVEKILLPNDSLIKKI